MTTYYENDSTAQVAHSLRTLNAEIKRTSRDLSHSLKLPRGYDEALSIAQDLAAQAAEVLEAVTELYEREMTGE